MSCLSQSGGLVQWDRQRPGREAPQLRSAHENARFRRSGAASRLGNTQFATRAPRAKGFFSHSNLSGVLCASQCVMPAGEATEIGWVQLFALVTGAAGGVSPVPAGGPFRKG